MAHRVIRDRRRAKVLIERQYYEDEDVIAEGGNDDGDGDGDDDDGAGPEGHRDAVEVFQDEDKRGPSQSGRSGGSGRRTGRSEGPSQPLIRSDHGSAVPSSRTSGRSTADGGGSVVASELPPRPTGRSTRRLNDGVDTESVQEVVGVAGGQRGASPSPGPSATGAGAAAGAPAASARTPLSSRTAGAASVPTSGRGPTTPTRASSRARFPTSPSRRGDNEFVSETHLPGTPVVPSSRQSPPPRLSRFCRAHVHG